MEQANVFSTYSGTKKKVSTAPATYLDFFIALAVVIGIGYVDELELAGPKVAFSLFYLVPVMFIGWRGRSWMVITVAISATGWWWWAEHSTAPDLDFVTLNWNAFTRLAIFLLCGMMLNHVRKERAIILEFLHKERDIAHTDSLTGIPNSRAFMAKLTEQFEKSKLDNSSICIVYLDLDNFKQINDTYGHSIGDDVLQEVGIFFHRCVRHSDVAARMGGDEFAAMLHDIEVETAKSIASRVLDAVKKISEKYPKAALGVSIGVAYFNSLPASAHELIGQADAMMYKGKGMGKGKITVWTTRQKEVEVL